MELPTYCIMEELSMEGKKIAGEKAAEYVKDGMTIGLGTGSTVYYTINKIGEMVKSGLKISAVSTSSVTTKIAKELGIPLVALNEVDYIDITIDGADEVDSQLNGIKGGGGALLYEKLVASASKRIIWVVDQSKKVDVLGKFPLPIEVIPFSYKHVIKELESMGFNPKLRIKNNEIFVTDEKNYIIDLFLNKIDNPEKMSDILNSIPGVVEHGLFLNITDRVIVGYNDGVDILSR